MPDGEDAEALGRGHLPFQVVAHHPGIASLDGEGRHGVAIGAFLGLAEAVLALDLDVVEAPGEVEALDLGPLAFRRAVGHQRQQDATGLEGVEGLVSAIEEADLLLAIGGEAVGERIAVSAARAGWPSAARRARAPPTISRRASPRRWRHSR